MAGIGNYSRKPKGERGYKQKCPKCGKKPCMCKKRDEK